MKGVMDCMYFYNISAMNRHRNGKYYGGDDVLLTSAIIAAGVMILVPIGIAVIQTVGYNNEQHKVYNSITVENGEEIIKGNIKGEDVCKDDYKVIYKDDQNLVVYVYSPDEEHRYLYTEFIADNIEITYVEDGSYIVSFDEENITEENYNEYLNKKNEEHKGAQRKRS